MGMRETDGGVSTEAEVISLKTGLRMGRLLASALWDIVINVLEPHASRARGDHSRQMKPESSQITQESIDYVPPNAQQFNTRPNLFTLDGNEALIKMTIEGRSPHMRHVSRTHLVNLVWLFERVNLDSDIFCDICWHIPKDRRHFHERFFLT